MSWLFGPSASTTQFDELVDKATSELLPPDNDEVLLLGLQCSDLIRARTIEAPLALKSVRRRLSHKNPNVQILALNFLDILVKNSGESLLLAVGNGKDGWLALIEELCRSSNHDLRQSATKHLQSWALAFQSRSSSTALSNSDLVHLYNRLRYSLQFPPVSQQLTSSMISSMSAPEWVDSDLCQRCRTPFTVTNRKHHCRNCGGVFCGECSSKRMKLDHLGIDQEVRVCDGCHKKLSLPGGKGQGRGGGSSFSFTPDAKTPQDPTTKNGGKSQEDIDFERALALSLAESQPPSQASAPSQPTYAQERSLPGVGYGYGSRPSEPAASNDTASMLPSKQLEEEDPDLAAAIRASLAEMPQPHASTSQASAPPHQYSQQSSSYTYVPQASTAPSVPSYELAMDEFDSLDTFANVLQNRQASLDDASELFYRADRNRGKMIRSLENSEVKSEMLDELNRKLQHAVRLYDSLLERRISRYNQPHQQGYQTYAQPQQHQQPYPSPHQQSYHSQQQQNQQYQQPYQPSQQSIHPQQYSQGTAPPTSSLHRQSSLSRNGYPSMQRQESASFDAQQYRSDQHHQAYAQPRYPEPQYEQHAAAAQQQQYGSTPAQQYDQPHPSDTQQYQMSPQSQQVGLPPTSPRMGYAQPYPAMTEDAHAPSQVQPQAQAYPDHNQSAPVEEYQQAPAAPIASDAPAQHQGSQPAEQAIYDNSGNKLRLQGYYSAASFPSVPSMPVGGLPSAPNAEIREHAIQQEQPKKPEEMLIEF